MSDILTKEIIKYIVGCVGAAPDVFGRLGLTDPKLKLVKTITVKYNDRDRDHDVYAGQLPISKSSLRGLLINLTVEDIPEYLFVFRLDDAPIFLAQISYDPDEEDEFFIKTLTYKEEDGERKEVWKQVGMFTKGRLLSDFDRFVSWGLSWEDCKDISDLYEAAVSVIDAQRY